MKITQAEVRKDQGWLRAFVTIDGTEYLLPVAKPIFLAQGMTQAPDGWPYEVQRREIFVELGNEEADTEDAEGITDPVLVGLACRARKLQAIDREAKIKIPTQSEALAEIVDLREKFAPF